MHELGHALHFANMDRALPFEYRWLGDNSITEAYAMLFDHRLQDAGWLARYSGLSKAEMPAYRRAAAFEELHFLRRYCAKLVYEVELHGETTSWSALPDLYVETLTGATGFRYQRSDAFVDVDALLRSALPAGVAAAGGVERDAAGAVQRGLVAQPGRRAVDRSRAVRARPARAGDGAGKAGRRQGAEFRAAGEGDRRNAGIGARC